MERCPSQFSVPPPISAAGTRRIQFVRVVSLVGMILISTQSFTVSALHSPSSTRTTNLDESNSDNSRRSVADVVVNSTTELEASSSNASIEAIFHHRHHHRRRFHASSYVRASLQRNHRRHQNHKHKKDVRKLSSDRGCLTNPTVCLTIPGWTTESFASTCCHTGWCTDIHFDGLNCGGCGQPCTFGYSCCSGVCIATATDPNNCGTCGNVCKGGKCAFGFCGYSSVDFVINSTDSR